MKTKVAREIPLDTVYKELKRFKNNALGNTNTLLGSQQCLIASNNRRERKKKLMFEAIRRP